MTYLDRHLVSKPHDLAIKIKTSIRLNLITAMDGSVSDAGMFLPSPQSKSVEVFQN